MRYRTVSRIPSSIRHIEHTKGANALVEAAVVDAARRIFAERGYDGASLDAVAAAAGLTKGAIYSRFSSKEALFVAATLERDEDVLADIEGATPSEWAQSWAQGLEAQRLWMMLGLEFRLYGLRKPALARTTRDWQRASHLRLREEIERRVSEAGVTLTVDADSAAALLAAVAAGLAQQHHTDPDVDAESLMTKMLGLLTVKP
jgi:AcrR family transcriptional regulator